MTRLPLQDLRCRWIGRLDTIQRFYRLIRVTWTRGVVGDGAGYSAKLTFAADAKLVSFPQRNSFKGWCFTLAGLRIHYCRSYGGRFAS